MIPPDQEIYEVEQRIAMRRAQVARNSKEVGNRAKQKLASPIALIAAAGLGFLLVRGVAKKRKELEHPKRRQGDHTKAAKVTGLAGLLMPIAMWLIPGMALMARTSSTRSGRRVGSPPVRWIF